jgi:hypothetical protein
MANESKIELSKDGFKFQYRRYLTDSAPGFILILLLLAACHRNHGINFPFVNLALTDSFNEVNAFIFFLLFLTATPIGVIVNVLGWLVLEALQKKLEMRIYKSRWLLKPFKDEYALETCKHQFAIEDGKWFQKVRDLEIALVNDFPEKADGIESLRGIAILLRNLALMSAAALVLPPIVALFREPRLCYWATHPLWALGLLFLAFLFFYLSAVISFYFHVQIVRSASILCALDEAKLLEKRLKTAKT